LPCPASDGFVSRSIHIQSQLSDLLQTAEMRAGNRGRFVYVGENAETSAAQIRDFSETVRVEIDVADQCSSENIGSDSQRGTIPPQDHPPNVAERRTIASPIIVSVR
jgi:hypothetical protein